DQRLAYYAENYAEWGYSSLNQLYTFYGRGMTPRIFAEHLRFNAMADAYVAHFRETLEASYSIPMLEEHFVAALAPAHERIHYRAYEMMRLPEGMEETDDAALGVYSEMAISEMSSSFLSAMGDTDDPESAFLAFVAPLLGVDEDASAATFVDRAWNLVEWSPYGAWLTDPARTPGDFTVFEAEEAVYLLYFVYVDDARYFEGNVRHILIRPEPPESLDGEVIDAERLLEIQAELHEAARIRAEEILAAWRNGSATEESFIELVREYSEDSWENNFSPGLFEDINRFSNLVPPFLNWAIDPIRQVGDTEVVETTHGFHIMYFVGHGDMYYRYIVSKQDLSNAAFSEWITEVLEIQVARESFFGRLVSEPAQQW
ncbi:MAG: peptidylprolyl isomerase, partial [Oscillospiraceae bacterium]|nr:peptidylprolyl isomerase [Oscillospiraceae bacterium]